MGGGCFYIIQKKKNIKQKELSDNKTIDNHKDAMNVTKEDVLLEDENKIFFNNWRGYKFKYPKYCEKISGDYNEDLGSILKCKNEDQNFIIVVKEYNSMINCSSSFCSLEISMDTISKNTSEDYKKIKSYFKNIKDNNAINGIFGDFKKNNDIKFMSGIYFDCPESMARSIEVVSSENDKNLSDSILGNIVSSVEVVDAQVNNSLNR